MPTTNARTAVEVVDWRRRVFALYDAVRLAESPEEAHELWRIERDDLMLRHPATPLLSADRALFEGLPIAPYDPAWRFELPILPAEPGGFEFATGTDGVVPFERVGRVDVPDAGSLDVWRLMSYGGGLFIPVRDGLAGRPGGTYGGGRYLVDTIKGADLGSDAVRGTIVLDFNFAYNPSCAYDPAWACPLAQPGNVLDVPVPVGELYAAGAHG
ncbi:MULTISPECIES: DUF1684 domain-containing protein [unclassified Microbacterium]|uniref:DUF1684 domain-containing protein n=1 Tax=unclassified Microbacterium TaxID=2609290 RepID=UPI0016050E95|nr:MULTISPECIES: DUF1684 domain-containing protein [unclassified Microbacterium]QNA93897.1 DUF1684 domain-containing protein [Microbacterium sp. Se63.02b]QYM64199.1 DUF1684 domain-containing protein [Microbacterium sp. Se5.02b]